MDGWNNNVSVTNIGWPDGPGGHWRENSWQARQDRRCKRRQQLAQVFPRGGNRHDRATAAFNRKDTLVIRESWTMCHNLQSFREEVFGTIQMTGPVSRHPGDGSV